MELDRAGTDDDAQRAALLEAQRGGCTCRKEDVIRRQELEAIFGRECGLQDCRAQDVETDDAQRLFRAGDADVELERRAHGAYARQPRDPWVERLRKARAPASHLDVGFTGDRADRRGDVLHRGPVHQVDRIAERDAERDARHGERDPAARPVRVEEHEQAQHARALYAPPVGSERQAFGTRRARWQRLAPIGSLAPWHATLRFSFSARACRSPAARRLPSPCLAPAPRAPFDTTSTASPAARSPRRSTW